LTWAGITECKVSPEGGGDCEKRMRPEKELERSKISMGLEDTRGGLYVVGFHGRKRRGGKVLHPQKATGGVLVKLSKGT